MDGKGEKKNQKKDGHAAFQPGHGGEEPENRGGMWEYGEGRAVLDLLRQSVAAGRVSAQTEEALAMLPATTQATEGLQRRTFTVLEVEAMQEQGVVHPDEKFELVEGEIVPMQAKSPVHELIKNSLVRDLARVLPDHLWLGVESTLYLSEDTALDPDIMISPAAFKHRRLSGPDVILAIEVSHTTLAYDRGPKARLYARHGVSEVWVIDAAKRETTVHRGPRPDGTWEIIETFGDRTALVHPSLPSFALRLAEL